MKPWKSKAFFFVFFFFLIFADSGSVNDNIMNDGFLGT